MALSIKNAEAEKLARDLAKETGDSITKVVIDALRAALIRVRGRRSAPTVYDSIIEISDRCAALPDLDERSPDEIIGYDDSGSFGSAGS